MTRFTSTRLRQNPTRERAFPLSAAVKSVVAALGFSALAVSGAAQPTQRTSEVSLDSLLNTRISVAAKYLQTSAEAAASITIVSAEDIRKLGFSNLQELLESVPGMYVSNDRNYPYLGTRGFGRPTDYNNRILVLIDGHTMNEPVWGGAPVGSDLPINLDAIERVEVVRGPGSALYGNSAMFAVINIVTKGGTHTNGGVVSARVGSGMERQAAVSVGYPIGARSSFAISAFGTETNGRSISYPEYRSSTNPEGVARGADWENAGSVLGTLVTGKFTTRVGLRSRTKGVPTGSYGTVFGDRRAQTVDDQVWGEVGAYGTMRPTLHASVRLYADRGVYAGQFPYDSGPVYADRAVTADAGADAMLIWDGSSRNRLTVGTELRRIIAARYQTRDGDGKVVGDDAPFGLVSLLAQDELQIHSKLKLVGGLRFDHKMTGWQAVTPRVAIVATPNSRSTIKLLYGEAYRAPSAAEADLNTDYYKLNPSLRAERIATTELAVEQRVRSSLLLSASVYNYDMHNLIESLASDTNSGFRYTNALSTRGRGVELAANFQPTDGPISLRWWYAVQETRDDSTQQQLTNSPQQTFNAATVLRGAFGTHAALTVRHESGRRTITGPSTSAFTRADLNIGYTPSTQSTWRWLRGTDISLRASNLFNTRYAVPGGLEHVQSSIQQDGRLLSLRLRREF